MWAWAFVRKLGVGSPPLAVQLAPGYLAFYSLLRDRIRPATVVGDEALVDLSKQTFIANQCRKQLNSLFEVSSLVPMRDAACNGVCSVMKQFRATVSMENELRVDSALSAKVLD